MLMIIVMLSQDLLKLQVKEILLKKKLILCSLKLKDLAKFTSMNIKIIKEIGDGLLIPRKVL